MTEHMEMNTEQFAEYLDRWGSDLKLWPEVHRTPGEDLLRTSNRARELAAEAEALDQWLVAGGKHRAPLCLQQQIVRRLPDQDFGQRLLDWFAAAGWRPALAATCVLLAGFAIGIALPESEDYTMVDDISMLAFSAPDEEFDDARQ